MSNQEIFLVGLGNRARNGKDSVAEFIKQENPNTIIYHFAEPLKKEVMNVERKIPLIYRTKSRWADHYWYNVWSKAGEYRSMSEESLPFLHKIFEDRNIDEYWGMDGNGSDDKKDGLMLQFWGTNWRRQKFGQDYWVKIVEDYFLTNVYEKNFDSPVFFLLPDTRFKNEVAWIKKMSDVKAHVTSCYLKVVRYNEDGTQYYDPDRDKNHPSEIDLEGVKCDYVIDAKSGEMEVLQEKTKEFLEHIKMNLSYVIV